MKLSRNRWQCSQVPLAKYNTTTRNQSTWTSVAPIEKILKSTKSNSHTFHLEVLKAPKKLFKNLLSRSQFSIHFQSPQICPNKTNNAPSMAKIQRNTSVSTHLLSPVNQTASPSEKRQLPSTSTAKLMVYRILCIITNGATNLLKIRYTTKKKFDITRSGMSVSIMVVLSAGVLLQNTGMKR